MSTPTVPPIPKVRHLARFAADLQYDLRHLEDAEEPGLLEEGYAFLKRIEAAIELAERTTETPSGVRVIRRGISGGRKVKAGGCP